ncbi:MAG: hypothetical protein H0W86_10850 [Armatimonadetes bacterium]|nr:hypothetical protein [Armatimonadota bacterium]
MDDKRTRALLAPPVKEMAEADAQRVQFDKTVDELSDKEADGKDASDRNELCRARLLDGPVNQITSFDLGEMTEAEPETAAKAWQRINDDAVDDYESGHRAARVLAGCMNLGPLDLARYMVMRASLIAEWEPNSGSELQIVDMMVQAFMMLEHWTGRHASHFMLGFDRDRESGKHVLPRVHQAEALEQSASMMERFQRMYTRQVKTLKDLRKGAPPVVVQNAGQVNVGQQQVNVAKVEGT